MSRCPNPDTGVEMLMSHSSGLSCQADEPGKGLRSWYQELKLVCKKFEVPRDLASQSGGRGLRHGGVKMLESGAEG